MPALRKAAFLLHLRMGRKASVQEDEDVGEMKFYFVYLKEARD